MSRDGKDPLVRRSLAMTRLAASLALTLTLAGCGGSSDSASPETTETTVTTEATTTEATTSDDPLGCLEAAGLSSVEERDIDFWRGYHDAPFYQVSVALLPSRAEARNGVRDATDVYAAQAGEYVVTGPAKAAAGGLVTADEGREADTLVREVASCLGG